LCRLVFRLSCRPTCEQWKCEPEDRARARVTLHSDVSVVLLHDSPADMEAHAQSDTGPTAMLNARCPIKALPNALLLPGAHPDAGPRPWSANTVLVRARVPPPPSDGARPTLGLARGWQRRSSPGRGASTRRAAAWPPAMLP